MKDNFNKLSYQPKAYFYFCECFVRNNIFRMIYGVLNRLYYII